MRPNLNQLPRLTREEKQAAEKFNSEVKQVEEMCERFAQELKDTGSMIQVLTQAPQLLVNKINKLIFATTLFKESMEFKKRMDTTPLKDA